MNIEQAKTQPDFVDVGGYAMPQSETTFTVNPPFIFRGRSMRILTPCDRVFIVSVVFANTQVAAYDLRTFETRPIDTFDPIAETTDLLNTPTIGPANRITVVVSNKTNRIQGVMFRFEGVSLVT